MNNKPIRPKSSLQASFLPRSISNKSIRPMSAFQFNSRTSIFLENSKSPKYHRSHSASSLWRVLNAAKCSEPLNQELLSPIRKNLMQKMDRLKMKRKEQQQRYQRTLKLIRKKCGKNSELEKERFVEEKNMIKYKKCATGTGFMTINDSLIFFQLYSSSNYNIRQMSLESIHKIEEWKEQIRNIHRYSIKQQKRKSVFLLHHLEQTTQQIFESNYQEILNLMIEITQTLQNVTISQICSPTLLFNFSYFLRKYFFELLNAETSYKLESVCIEIMCYLTMNQHFAQHYEQELLCLMSSPLKQCLIPTQMTIFLLKGFGNLLTIERSRESMINFLQMINIEHVLYLFLVDKNNKFEEIYEFENENETFDDVLLWFLYKYTKYCLSLEDKAISHLKLEEQLFVYLQTKIKQLQKDEKFNRRYYFYISNILVAGEIQITQSCFKSEIISIFYRKWNYFETAQLFFYFSHFYQFSDLQSYLEDILYTIAFEESGYKYKKRNQLFLRGIYNFLEKNQSKTKIWISAYTSEFEEILNKKQEIFEELSNLNQMMDFGGE